eukprot:6206534-Pleurochrysis_carterae.AAC.1
MSRQPSTRIPTSTRAPEHPKYLRAWRRAAARARAPASSARAGRAPRPRRGRAASHDARPSRTRRPEPCSPVPPRHAEGMQSTAHRTTYPPPPTYLPGPMYPASQEGRQFFDCRATRLSAYPLCTRLPNQRLVVLSEDFSTHAVAVDSAGWGYEVNNWVPFHVATYLLTYLTCWLAPFHTRVCMHPSAGKQTPIGVQTKVSFMKTAAFSCRVCGSRCEALLRLSALVLVAMWRFLDGVNPAVTAPRATRRGDPCRSGCPRRRKKRLASVANRLVFAAA